MGGILGLIIGIEYFQLLWDLKDGFWRFSGYRMALNQKPRNVSLVEGRSSSDFYTQWWFIEKEKMKKTACRVVEALGRDTRRIRKREKESRIPKGRAHRVFCVYSRLAFYLGQTGIRLNALIKPRTSSGRGRWPSCLRRRVDDFLPSSDSEGPIPGPSLSGREDVDVTSAVNSDSLQTASGERLFN